MPRPGPRPYECVRRAWHSDRHQPIRGSLIKEIFRVANEIHSSSTKQNKEWQEKLPIVVLKAEEIMYSKANSEAEYMDLKTLWDRTNDAINTIIRRDEGSETGEFLQPCIEAALNLGCTPRRASRSQRNCHPRCYLGPSTTEVDQAAANCSNPVIPHNRLGSDPRTSLAQNNITAAMKFASVPKNVPTTNYEKLVGVTNYAATNSFSGYPLYYGHIPQFEPHCRGLVYLPKPVYDAVEPAKGDVVPNLRRQEDSAVKNTESRDANLTLDRSKIGCDLSLRLGPLSVSAVPIPTSIENKRTQDVKTDVSPHGPKFCDQLPMLDKGFSLPPRGNAYDSFGSFKSIGALATVRKRKGGFDQPTTMEDQQFCLQPKLPFRHVKGL